MKSDDLILAALNEYECMVREDGLRASQEGDVVYAETLYQCSDEAASEIDRRLDARSNDDLASRFKRAWQVLTGHRY